MHPQKSKPNPDSPTPNRVAIIHDVAGTTMPLPPFHDPDLTLPATSSHLNLSDLASIPNIVLCESARSLHLRPPQSVARSWSNLETAVMCDTHLDIESCRHRCPASLLRRLTALTWQCRSTLPQHHRPFIIASSSPIPCRRWQNQITTSCRQKEIGFKSYLIRCRTIANPTRNHKWIHIDQICNVKIKICNLSW